MSSSPKPCFVCISSLANMKRTVVKTSQGNHNDLPVLTAPVERERYPPGTEKKKNFRELFGQERVVRSSGRGQQRNRLRRVFPASRVKDERVRTSGRVELARCVSIERRITSGRVVGAGGVAQERLKTAGRATDPLIWFSESGFIGVYPWPEFFPTATDRHRFLVATRRVRACTHNR